MKPKTNLPPLSHWLPSYIRLPLIVTVLWNSLVYYGARLIAQDWPHAIWELPLDGKIPFLPWTASIYYASFLFWTVNYILCARSSKARAYRFLSADFLAKGLCFLLFLLFPTTNLRPVVEEGGFWNGVMRLLYQSDAADNLFPSIHCLSSWFSYIGLRDREDIPLWYRRFSLLAAFAIFLSTLTTKQHVIVDVLGGVLLAQLCYLVTDRIGFSGFYARIFDRLPKKDPPHPL